MTLHGREAPDHMSDVEEGSQGSDRLVAHKRLDVADSRGRHGGGLKRNAGDVQSRENVHRLKAPARPTAHLLFKADIRGSHAFNQQRLQQREQDDASDIP